MTIEYTPTEVIEEKRQGALFTVVCPCCRAKHGRSVPLAECHEVTLICPSCQRMLIINAHVVFDYQDWFSTHQISQ